MARAERAINKLLNCCSNLDWVSAIMFPFMENNLDFFPIAWGVMRSGMYLTCINRYLTPDEAAYIVQDSTSCVIFASATLAQSQALVPLIPGCPHRFVVGGDIAGFDDYAATVSNYATTPIADERAGDTMLYSSGTTGRPKGIKRPSPENMSAQAPRRGDRQSLWPQRRYRIPITGAPIPRRAFRVLHPHSRSGRHCRDDAQFRP